MWKSCVRVAETAIAAYSYQKNGACGLMARGENLVRIDERQT